MGGLLTLVWALVVWQWQDPFTATSTHWKQRRLSQKLSSEFASYHPPFHVKTADLAAERVQIAAEAARFRRDAKPGGAIGRIVIPRVGLNMVLVNGTDHETLKQGPGRDARTFMPGQNRLIYVAGHRTTYLYATFLYRASAHRVVSATDLSVLHSPRHEVLELQACHPRFFATHRYIVYARLASVVPRGGTPYTVAAVAPPAR